jgi:hypothetical protein
VAARRIQNYVVFVTEAGLAATVNSYDWSFTNGGVTNQTTSNGIAEFTPQNTGSLVVAVNLKSAANATLHTVTLTQQVISLNEALELKIEQEENNFPGAGNPETSRELVNDIRPYVNAILPIASDEIYNKAICSLAYARTLQTTQIRRNLLNEDLANILKTQPANFYSQAKDGIGICKTRPQLLAMFLDNPASAGNKYLNIATLELAAGANAAARTANATAIETAFNALGVDVHTDLFNLLRFPKSHVAMAKRIFDSLKERYYPDVAPSVTTVATYLGVTADAKKLITEYEKGPVALGSGSSALAASTFSNSVYRLFIHTVWTIPVTALPGTPPAAGGGTTTPATVGIPEKLPSLTFIAHRDTEAGFSAGSLGFLRNAFLYHESYALGPQEVRSFEELVSILQSTADPIGRLRIVTHFGAPSGTTSLQNVGVMFMPFFTGQTRNNSTASDHQCIAEHFKYGINDVEGLKAQFEVRVFANLSPDFLQGLTMNTSADTTQREFHDAIFRYLQHNNHASLSPFGLQTSGTPSASVRIILKWAAGLFFLNATINVQATQPSTIAPTPINPAIKTAFINAIQNKIATLVTPTGATIQANIDPLVLAYSSLTYSAVGATTFHNSISYTFSSVYLENHNTLRTQLAIVKTRLNNSFVDVRGCRIGQDRNFLQALRTFFGNPGSEPTVSGPEWYQSFGTMGSYETSGSLTGTEAIMDSAFNSGISGTRITGGDVQREYSAWAGRIGINSQISFWINLFNGNVFDIIALSWRSLLPPIGMQSARLAALATQNYADSIGTIKSIFHIDSTTAPIAADCTTFETNSFPSIATLVGIQTAVTPLTDSSTQPEMQTQLTALTNLATTLSATLPVAPAPITKAHLTTCIDTLKQRLVTLSGMTPLVATIKTRLADPKSGYRYLLDIGLPLIVQSASREGDSRLMFYTDIMPNALKSYKKIQFEGPLPAATITAIDALNPSGAMVKNTQSTPDPNDDTYNDTGTGLFFSGLSVDHADTQSAIIPSEEFHAHIKTEPV